MTEFLGTDLTGATFDGVDLSHAQFRDVDLTGARFRLVSLQGVVVRGALLEDLELSGEINNLLVNGVDVAPLVEAELNRRHPERILMQPDDAAGFRAAWEVLERRWDETVARIRSVEADLLHERIDGEWSVIENLRHLVFATDAWVRRAVLGEAAPWDPLDLPHDGMPDTPGVPRDLTARPSLDQVLALRADRMATVRGVIGGLTDAALAGTTEAVDEVGYPESLPFPLLRCLRAVVSEEWAHRLYVERDLDVLATWPGGERQVSGSGQ